VTERPEQGRPDTPDTLRRQGDPKQLRLDKPRTGVMPTREADRVHEYGRLLNLNHFGDLDDEELERRRQELGVETDDQLQKAENVSVVYRYLELQNRRDYDGIIELHHNPYVNKTFFGRHPIDPRAHVRTLEGYFKLFPDATTEANKIIAAEGNTVVVRTTARGTQAREIPGSMIGSPGKQIAVTLIHAIEVDDGRIAGCETTSPFENQWESDIVNSSFPGLGGDISDPRARQGIDADDELWVERLAEAPGVPLSDTERQLRFPELAQLRKQLDVGRNQCQALVERTMRRCTKQAASDSI
jgi:predicted ester cyclase